MVEIKGHSVREAIASIRERLGEAGFLAFVGRLDDQTKELVQGGIQATLWVPLDLFARFLDAHVRYNFDGQRGALAPLTERIVEAQFRGVYKAFATLMGPESMLERISAVNAAYFRGVAVDRRVSKGRAEVRHVGLEKRHEVLEPVILGFYRKALEACGAQDVKVEMTTPISEGKGYAGVTATWS